MNNEQIFREVVGHIKTFGWHVTGVMAERNSPAFAYSVGAPSQELPEIIISGLNPKTGCILINDLLRSIKSGAETLREDEPYTEVANMPCYLRKLTAEQAKDHMTMALMWARDHTKPFVAYQLVYPDVAGLFPWEAGYNFPKQELLFNK